MGTNSTKPRKAVHIYVHGVHVDVQTQLAREYTNIAQISGTNKIVPITITWHARGRGHVRLRVYARSAEGINDYIRTN